MKNHDDSLSEGEEPVLLVKLSKDKGQFGEMVQAMEKAGLLEDGALDIIMDMNAQAVVNLVSRMSGSVEVAEVQEMTRDQRDALMATEGLTVAILIFGKMLETYSEVISDHSDMTPTMKFNGLNGMIQLLGNCLSLMVPMVGATYEIEIPGEFNEQVFDIVNPEGDQQSGSGRGTGHFGTYL